MEWNKLQEENRNVQKNAAILDKVKTAEQREWYIRKIAENGWSCKRADAISHRN